MQRNFTKEIGDGYRESPWFKLAEDMAGDYFWSPDSIFNKKFQYLDTSRIVELACGYGRHVPYYSGGVITLVDINQENIDYCKKRFSDQKNIEYVVTAGSDFSGIDDNSQTSIFSFDSVVHFELLDIAAYLKDAYRVLVPGGQCLIHHSNADYCPEFAWHQKPHGRNFMSADIFRHLAHRAGLSVLSQDIISIPTIPDASDNAYFQHGIDCLTLCVKCS